MKDQIKHIFFDLDHTLWDFEVNSAKAYERCFQDFDIEIALSDFLAIYTPINFAYWKLYREGGVSKKELKYRRLRDVFDRFNYKISDDKIHNLSEVYLAYLPHFTALFEGAKNVLDYLYKHYKLHIITNGFNEVQNKKLKASGISHYFESIVTSEMVGVQKPNPKVFLYAMKKANAQPEESMMIGDNLEADVLGALNTGMYAIYFNPLKEISDVPFDIEIHHLNEIKNYL